MAATKTKSNRKSCTVISKGDVTLDGVEGVVFCKEYVPHDTVKRGNVARFYNNRKGSTLVVYPEVRRMFIDGNERRFNKDATMNAQIAKRMNIDNTEDAA